MKGQKHKERERESKQRDREHGRKRESGKEREIEKQKGKREQKSEVKLSPFFLIRRFRGARRVAIQYMLSAGDIILPHACPREHLLTTRTFAPLFSLRRTQTGAQIYYKTDG
jgi:hypothetical protein